ncbi:hypothetical protein CAPTEDRAFT_192908 [Capitella teleta]|uniref:Uncharacterized protein n=1 Tax=Capitella teleta TaxID=283909 RepID=R7V027_CAPTE|nr:hypothetical protein CAPTEDRAFT_192908 [Capitella teleta]|eukprot:ELU11882.1 hypothetical protein CAPTEDRAFT_192908 [Capitella teleta]
MNDVTQEIDDLIDTKCNSGQCCYDHMVRARDVLKAMRAMKPGKSDVNDVISSDYIVESCGQKIKDILPGRSSMSSQACEDKHVVISHVLAYVSIYSNRASCTSIKIAALAFYSEEEIKAAKDLLCAKAHVHAKDVNIDSEMANRQNTSTRSAKEATLDDTVGIIQKIDKVEHSLMFVVDDVTRVLSLNPESGTSMLLIEEMAAMKKRNAQNDQAEETATKESKTKLEKKRYKKQKTSQGTADNSDQFLSGPKTVKVALTRAHPDSTVDGLKNYIKTKGKEQNIEDIKVEDRSSPEWKTKRFVVTLSAEAQDVVMNTDFWPKGIQF